MAKFENLKLGDQVMRQSTLVWTSADGSGSQRNPDEYYLVTDFWFDPVKGQHKAASGEFVAIQRICHRTGELIGSKRAHTRRGLASNSYSMADRDFMEYVKARNQAYTDGKVVGIGQGRKRR